MFRILAILNDAPYGSERSYNGLRLADSLARRDAAEVHKGTLETLTDWTLWADRILNFRKNLSPPAG